MTNFRSPHHSHEVEELSKSLRIGRPKNSKSGNFQAGTLPGFAVLFLAFGDG